MADDQNREEAGRGAREKYRHDNDARDPIEGDVRNETKPDTKGEARGSARENVGNTARGTAAAPTGPEGNDNGPPRGANRTRG